MVSESVENEKIIPLLKENFLFSELNRDELASVSSFCQIADFSKGEVLFEQDQQGSSCYIIIRGAVDIVRKVPTGDQETPEEETLIAQLLPGDTFGEKELFTRSAHDAAAVVTSHEGAGLLLFPGKNKDLSGFCRTFPSAASKILIAHLKSTAGRLRQANDIIKENSPLVQELKKQVYGDKLTGLYNKTYLEEELPVLMKGSGHLALIMFKPDNFKDINDTYGHEAGDQAIVLIASRLKKLFSDNTVIVRYMGNEHAVVLTGAGKKEAREGAENIRSAMNTLDLSVITGKDPFRLTVSCGIALYPAHALEGSSLIELAHELPLKGRGLGGNMILFAEEK
jgi:diguanylate cyclase (GGDEF)-like protein